MIRFAWRQMRLSAVSTATVLVLLATILALVEHSMTSAMHSSGLSACLSGNGDCTDLAATFVDRYAVWQGLVFGATFAPALVGLFWGAPMIAREMEQGTHRLAWSQSVSRWRWFAAKVGLYVLGAIALGAALTWLFTWWYGPLSRVQPHAYSAIQPQVFDSRGVVLVATMLYALALGTAAGAVVRRTVPAMGITVAGYLGARLFFLFERGHLIAPRSVTFPIGQFPENVLASSWNLSNDLIDGGGHLTDMRSVLAACPIGFGGKAPEFVTCAQAHGFQRLVTYQPLSRFWPLQAFESSILAGTAILLLVLAAWWTLRRAS